MTKFGETLLYQIYPIKLDIFIELQNIGTGSRPDISNLGWTYPMYQTYLPSNRVPKP
jgi:hypothetical protein